MLVKIDDREKNILMKELAEMEIICYPERLECGDYVWEDVCIERKSIDDFCTSIMDGRMESQAKAMKEKFKWNYILIAGSIKDRTSTINENCILGMLSKLVVELDMKIIMVDNEHQLAFVLKRILERHEKMKGISNKVLDEGEKNG